MTITLSKEEILRILEEKLAEGGIVVDTERAQLVYEEDRFAEIRAENYRIEFFVR